MSAVLLNAPTDFTWATSSRLLATPCEQWPQLKPPGKKTRKTKDELRYELARRYQAANVAAARIILSQPLWYPGLMTEWAQHFQSNIRRHAA